MTSFFRRAGYFVLVVVVASVVTLSAAQPRASWFDEPATILKPDNYNPANKYPVVVVLPPTNWTAVEFWQNYYSKLPSPHNYFVLLPAGNITSDNYLPDFMAFVGWYNNMVRRELQNLSQSYTIDLSNCILTGHSVGGDIGWGLTALSPDLYSGFVLSGTRCSYPMGSATVKKLKDKGFRAYFYIGANDDKARKDGMQAACEKLKTGNISLFYKEIAGVGHADYHGASSYLYREIPKLIATGRQIARNDNNEPTVAPPRPTPKPSAQANSRYTALKYDRSTDVATVRYLVQVDTDSDEFVKSLFELLKKMHQKFPNAGFYNVDYDHSDAGHRSYTVTREDYRAWAIEKTMSMEDFSNQFRMSEW